MSKIGSFFREVVEEDIRLIEKINECIENKDNSIIDILDKDYYMLNKITDPKEDNEKLHEVINSMGIFTALIEMGQLLIIRNKMDKFHRRLSDRNLYIKVCEVGLKVLKDNFENSEDIETFNKMYQECLYYKDKFLSIFK
ncbi:MAG: hypothetical protein ACI3T9_07750 [Romboutsia timonensis]